MRSETKKWITRAESDLKAANDSLKSGNYNWACLQAQQSAEESLKALLYDRGGTPVAHSLEEMIDEASKIGRSLRTREEVRFLDKVFIPTCYTNVLAGNPTPFEFYGRGDTEKCISSAESILKTVKKRLFIIEGDEAITALKKAGFEDASKRGKGSHN
jgi:HEPN domain-containing protein